MSKFIIEGGHTLSGSITPMGAKNEALQVICASLLTTEEVTIENVPEILDVHNLIDLILRMGVKVTHCGHGCYSFRADELDRDYINSRDYIERCSRLRGSVQIGRASCRERVSPYV